MTTSIDQQFVEYVVKSIVSNPDAVQIDRRIDEKGVLLELTVDAEDLGRVIGKRGATAQSLRTLLRALGTKNEARYNLKIIDVDRPEGMSQPAADDAASSAATTATDDDNDAPVNDAVASEEAEAQTAPVHEATIEDKESDAVSRTRRELADLDDLDI